MRVIALLLFTAIWSAPALAATSSDLVLKRVMLSSGGVGYFEYEAQVSGAATLGLDVPLDEVDDVLKSLVVFDTEGGVGSIELPGKDGSRAAFGDIPLDPAALSSPLAYLNGLQGIEVQVTGPRPMTGRVMRAETVTTEVPGRDGAPPAQVPRTRVTLLTEAGLQQFLLEDAESVQVTDAKLREGIGKALDELRGASSRDKRHLTLHVAGSDQRIVRVGYVVAAPLWKTTYRLVLPDAGKDKATLQGWAVLENESGVDWNGVELTLQSGNPVTFRQALYKSYFVDRPEVPVDVFNRILPPEDTRATTYRSVTFAGKAAGAPAPPPPPAPMMLEAERSDSPAAATLAPAQNAATETEAEEAAVFRLPKPVVLAAGHTASVPLLDKQVTGVAVDLARDGSGHPLAAVKLTNDTGAALPPGVLTLYAPGGDTFFAGDARLGNLPAGENRLLSFAEDLRTTVEWNAPETKTLTSLTAASGVLKVEQKSRQTRKIAVTAPASGPVRTLLEIHREPDWTLAVDGGTPDDTEQTADAWRLPVSLKPGETRTLVVRVDSVDRQTIELNADAADQIIAYANEDGLSPEARAAMQRLAALQQTAATQDAEKTRLDAVAARITADEGRVRENLKAVQSGDALHTRLTKQLDADEDQMAATSRDIDAATAAADKARRELAEAIAGLKL